jgi:hypothetical protein
VFQLSHTWYLNDLKFNFKFEELHIRICGAVCSGESMLPVSMELKLFKRGVDTPRIIYNADSILPHHYRVKCQMTLHSVHRRFCSKKSKTSLKNSIPWKNASIFLEILEKEWLSLSTLRTSHMRFRDLIQTEKNDKCRNGCKDEIVSLTFVS